MEVSVVSETMRPVGVAGGAGGGGAAIVMPVTWVDQSLVTRSSSAPVADRTRR